MGQDVAYSTSGWKLPLDKRLARRYFINMMSIKQHCVDYLGVDYLGVDDLGVKNLEMRIIVACMQQGALP